MKMLNFKRLFLATVYSFLGLFLSGSITAFDKAGVVNLNVASVDSHEPNGWVIPPTKGV